MKRRHASPLFHDLSQENLYLKAETAKYQQMIADLQSSYTYAKNKKLTQEYHEMKKDYTQLKQQLDEMTIDQDDAASKIQDLSYSKSELLHKIVLLHEMLQKETFHRRKETEEKHRLHLKVVKYKEISQQLNERMQDQDKRLAKEEKKGNTLSAVIEKLQQTLGDKNAELNLLQEGVKHLQERFFETQEKLLQIEKAKEAIFYETLTSYQKQLAESEEWIASHFADIDQSAQANSQPFSRDSLLQTTEEIEPILKKLNEQVQTLQAQVDAVQQNGEVMTVKIEGFKKQRDHLSKERKIVYTVDQKK
ncbi:MULTISPECIES: sigmaE regulated sporulation protein [Bacillus]|uniref:sigmaE regulated sporulation protein n=1 Tax=Bacillus TaxID=1386 RepID=UPI0007EEB058|nr:sigmaE regulated sporulation protein [Bacillus pumilus]MBB6602776.1 sigmaE regulated sporulation protein [Bacillus pumilus]MBU8573043.1 sigmaE regulated sporulation protein [Bacillus pumilus]OBS87096.1 sigmaE regulated sporulation protein [Bacillus pumilus]PRS64300.1 sigmaE regulated sporulation protein [Bacillus pumilus]